MNKKTTPVTKMSKKARRILHAKQRVTWSFSPVSRVKDSKKVYKRSKTKHKTNDWDG
ncbi:MAG: hypothetical protein GXZ04_04685 [Clostridiales bacterium]|nr:hypothetical protein [Clostridiales bacterium]